MYRLLGNTVVRLWPAILLGWVVALVALKLSAPNWQDVIEEGEFAFLPDEMPSLAGERQYEDAWGEPFASNIALVVRRERTKLNEQDRDFIVDVLKPRLVEIVERIGIPEPSDQATESAEAATTTEPADEESIEKKIKTFDLTGWQKILDSSDGTATMVVINLKTEFFNAKNIPLIDAIADLIERDGELYQKDASGKSPVPPGLELALSGSATVGRDMMRAATESSKATEHWTVILVVSLLLIIYRAPVLAIIPLATVAVATEFSLAFLTVLADHGIVSLFNGIEVYVKILCYGAGVDYCLFLIARFKEELDDGVETAEAVSGSIAKVGEALVASAGTVICGIGMMIFAEFGKFRQAGIAITIGLVIVLIASLTFTPALLRLAGRWSFWPHVATRRVRSSGGWVSATGLMASLLRKNVFQAIWQKTSEVILEKPAFVLTLSIALMLPFSVIAIVCFDNLSYGLLSELPKDTTSVLGAKAIQKHYPDGIAGPVTLLLHNPEMNFQDDDSQEFVNKLVESLYERKDELNLADIRSVVHPFGIAIARAEEAALKDDSEAPAKPFNPLAAIERRATLFKAQQHYISQTESFDGSMTQIDFVSSDDPFSRDSIRQFVELKDDVLAEAQKFLSTDATLNVYGIGPTASIRDLKTVTDRDQRVVDALVLMGIFLILVALLRQVTIPVYLILSVFFSYLVTLGATFAFFYALDPSGFAGLDWKVPTFLFTILIAVGEDYNIFLMTRIREEQITHGPVKGVAIALTRTGSIISSCGIIMAGTFSSLLAGTLAGMHQLGFALAFGVLLDTFVVRPILVPAFLVLYYEGRLGILKPPGDLALAGATQSSLESPPEESTTAATDEPADDSVDAPGSGDAAVPPSVESKA
ncbi:MAG: RND superfamily putative drug exporter [Planctomycetaceae bacterium]|jgi:RND superfamily putative drug exporter